MSKNSKSLIIAMGAAISTLIPQIGFAADDYAASVATTGSVQLSSSKTGTIDTSGDIDWLRVTLIANTTYVIDIKGAGSNSGTLSDPYASLLDSTGAKVAEDDDSGGNANAQITFTPDATGTYYVAVGGYDTATGTYTVSLAATASGANDSALRIGAVFSTAQPVAGSFLRFFNTGTSAGKVTITLYDADTGLARGQWTSPNILPNAEVQYYVGDLETNGSVSGTRPPYFTATVDTDITGYFQHVLYRPGEGTLTNLSACPDSMTGDTTRLAGVHSSLLAVPSIALPSSIVAVNTGSVSASATIGVYDARNGVKIGNYTTPAIPPNGQAITSVAAMETAMNKVPSATSGIYHYVMKLENPTTFPGFLQNLLYNVQQGVTTDMTAWCSLTP